MGHSVRYAYDGWAWLVLAIVITLWALAYFKGTSIMSSIVCIFVVAAWLIALLDLGILSEHFKTYAAYALLIPGILAIYLASAIVINTACSKEKVKVTGPWIKDPESIVDLKNK